MRLIVAAVEQQLLKKEIETLEQFNWTNIGVNVDCYRKEEMLATPYETKITTIATVSGVWVLLLFLCPGLFFNSTTHWIKEIHSPLYNMKSCCCNVILYLLEIGIRQLAQIHTYWQIDVVSRTVSGSELIKTSCSTRYFLLSFCPHPDVQFTWTVKHQSQQPVSIKQGQKLSFIEIETDHMQYLRSVVAVCRNPVYLHKCKIYHRHNFLSLFIHFHTI